MKVVTSQQMANIEDKAYKEGASEADFMEEAGSGVALVVHDYVEENSLDRNVFIFCGKGNNGGDAYVAGIHLLHLDYDVFAYHLFPLDECTHLCQINYNRFMQEGGRMIEVTSPDDIRLPTKGTIVDGIFGTGFHGSVAEPVATIIKKINASGLPIIAVDIPSGLDGATGEAQGEVVIAKETAFLGLPKTGFFLQNGWDQVGKIRYVDFGLSQRYIEESEASLIMLSTDMMRPHLPKIKPSRHKYEAGLVVGLGGSPTMPGAAILSATSALHGGAGIVRLLHPQGMETQLLSSPYEIIKIPYEPNDAESVIEAMNKASATFIGPGIGRSQEALELLKRTLPRLSKPCVIDADALTLLSENDIPLPDRCILTPHRGEMNRLLGITEKNPPLTMDYLQQCMQYAKNKRATIILKGGPTFILHPGEPIMVNPRGDPGMATAGSGDVLTGLVAALLAQGLPLSYAASLGVYIHGIAGEFAAKEHSSYCMTASDIMYQFPEGFRLLDL